MTVAAVHSEGKPRRALKKGGGREGRAQGKGKKRCKSFVWEEEEEEEEEGDDDGASAV